MNEIHLIWCKIIWNPTTILDFKIRNGSTTDITAGMFHRYCINYSVRVVDFDRFIMIVKALNND